MNHTDTIQVYAACLASYNNGILYGRWIDATQGAEHIRKEVAEMLSASPIENAEEYAIHDYDGFEGLSLSEWETPASISEVAEFIQEHGDLGALLAQHYSDIESARTAIEDYYLGEYDSVADYAREYVESACSVPSELEYYIDYDAMARDMAINDFVVIETSDYQVHLFLHH